MATDNSDGCLERVRSSDASEEARGADDVEGCDTEKLAGVKGAGFFEDGGNDRDSRVYGVGDDKDMSSGGDAGDGGGKVANNACVGLGGCKRD